VRALDQRWRPTGWRRLAATMAALALLALAGLSAPRLAALAQDQTQPAATQPAAPADKPAEATQQPAPTPASNQPTAAEAQGSPLQGVLYDDPSAFIFILITIIMGGAAGYSTGKAIAQTWRPGWHLIASAIVLGVAVRFIHYALFGASFLSVHYYVIDTLLVLAATFLGFRLTRVKQMTTRYSWLYRPAGAFFWRAVDPGSRGVSST
jgi:hypothetical protein